MLRFTDSDLDQLLHIRIDKSNQLYFIILYRQQTWWVQQKAILPFVPIILQLPSPWLGRRLGLVVAWEIALVAHENAGWVWVCVHVAACVQARPMHEAYKESVQWGRGTRPAVVEIGLTSCPVKYLFPSPPQVHVSGHKYWSICTQDTPVYLIRDVQSIIQWLKKPSQCLAVSERWADIKSEKFCKIVKK